MKEMAEVIKILVNYPHLLTDQIVQAGIEEGDAGLLDYLPSKYLTWENVGKFICEGDKARFGSSFSLNRIPQALRTYAFCKFAVEAHVSNYFEVPVEHRDRSFLELIIQANPDSLKYYAHTPASVWTKELAYKGVNALIHKEKYMYSSYNSRNGRSYTPPTNLYLTQAFLSYIPAKLKDGRFYLGLFSNTDLKAEDVLLLTPNKHKQAAFYLALAGADFSLVPKQKYSYQHFKIALSGNKTILDFEKDTETMFRIEACMDNELADIILKGYPAYFPQLPKKFQTSCRLLYAIQHANGGWFIEKIDKGMLTPTVCRAIIKKKCRIPEFPREIWTEDFVKYCTEHGHYGYWVPSMPTHLMTQELADRIIDENLNYLRYVSQEFITPELAVKINRSGRNDMRNFIPAQYFSEFTNETGLPNEFMGGEVSFTSLREHADNYIYCRLGQTYLGYYWDGEGKKLIMTRRSSASIFPQHIFERRIGTFHTTWVEKTVANNDERFVRPSIPEKLKEIAFNSYCGLEYLGTYLGVDYYANTFLGTSFLYCALVKNMPVFRKTRELIVEAIKDLLEGK